MGKKKSHLLQLTEFGSGHQGKSGLRTQNPSYSAIYNTDQNRMTSRICNKFSLCKSGGIVSSRQMTEFDLEGLFQSQQVYDSVIKCFFYQNSSPDPKWKARSLRIFF